LAARRPESVVSLYCSRRHANSATGERKSPGEVQGQSTCRRFMGQGQVLFIGARDATLARVLTMAQCLCPSPSVSVTSGQRLKTECRTRARRPRARRDTSPPQGDHKPARGGSKARHLTQDCLTVRLVYKISNYLQGSLRLSQC